GTSGLPGPADADAQGREVAAAKAERPAEQRRGGPLEARRARQAAGDALHVLVGQLAARRRRALEHPAQHVALGLGQVLGELLEPGTEVFDLLLSYLFCHCLLLLVSATTTN